MDNNAETTRILNKLTDNITINRAEYALLLRDKTQLDMVLTLRLQGGYAADSVLDAILKERGLKA